MSSVSWARRHRIDPHPITAILMSSKPLLTYLRRGWPHCDNPVIGQGFARLLPCPSQAGEPIG